MNSSSVRGRINAMIFSLHGPDGGQEFQIGKNMFLLIVYRAWKNLYYM